eukprot:1232253-Alexandrium_andersonii.AAC.1
MRSRPASRFGHELRATGLRECPSHHRHARTTERHHSPLVSATGWVGIRWGMDFGAGTSLKQSHVFRHYVYK